jgi:hypothetical protein
MDRSPFAMKPLLLLSACAVALSTAAGCAPSGPPKARAALDCPPSQGDLERTNVAADGKSCVYVSRDGDEVSLRLIPVSASYQATLQPIEQELQGELQIEQQAADTAASSAASEAARAAKQAADDAVSAAKGDEDSDGGEHGSSSDRAHIDLPGIHIDADDSGKADVNVGMVHVNAGEDGAVVRMARDVRLRGEAFSPEKRGFRATYILAKDNLKDGWKAVGYEAGGPKAGPITVAVVKSKTGDRHDIFGDVKRLVRRNAGV